MDFTLSYGADPPHQPLHAGSRRGPDGFLNLRSVGATYTTNRRLLPGIDSHAWTHRLRVSPDTTTARVSAVGNAGSSRHRGAFAWCIPCGRIVEDSEPFRPGPSQPNFTKSGLFAFRTACDDCIDSQYRSGLRQTKTGRSKNRVGWRHDTGSVHCMAYHHSSRRLPYQQ